MRRRLSRVFLPILLGVVSFAPHAWGCLLRRTYYFRDFGMAFYPFHAFWARELAAGRFPFWNPFIQEGVFAFPMLYPPDWLLVLFQGPAAMSCLLALHFPIAAVSAYLLARELRADRPGAFLAGAVYSVGGLAIASLNLYVFLQALALAPLVAFALMRAATRGGRWIAGAALCLALSLTTAQEFVIQAVVLGATLGLMSARGRPRAAAAVGLSLLVGLTLASVPLSLVAGVLPETMRGHGFPLGLRMSYSVHPAALLQVLMRDVFGSLSSPLELWWGHRFFTKGFSYFISIYLGPSTIAVACCGVGALAPARRWALLAMGGLALWYALGAHAGLAPALSSLPLVRSFRFPSKALLLPYMVSAILVGRGARRLGAGGGWRTYVAAACTLGAITLVLALGAAALPNQLGEWMGSDPTKNAIVSALVSRDCVWATVLSALGASAGLAVRAGRVPAARGAWLVGGLLVADLLRSASGVNPQTVPVFFDLLPETRAAGLDRLDGGRVFTYGTAVSPAFAAFLDRRVPGGLLLASFVKRQMLGSYVHVLDGIETVPADDVGAFVFTPPEIAPDEYDPRLVDRILPRLRNSAVSRVISLDPLDHPDLDLTTTVPTGVDGLDIRIYALRDTWPRAYVACHAVHAPDRVAAWSRAFAVDFDPRSDVALEQPGTAGCSSGVVRRASGVPGHDVYDVDVVGGPGYLVTRDSYARGWTAHAGADELAVVRANGKHRAVALGPGHHRIVLDYEPPGLRRGIWGLALGIALATGAWLKAPFKSRAGR